MTPGALDPNGSAERWRAHLALLHLARLAELGTAGYPPKTRRRSRNINVACHTIAVSCLLFALTYYAEDPALYSTAVWVNLVMMVAALMVPVIHRIHEVAGAVFMAVVLMGGLPSSRRCSDAGSAHSSTACRATFSPPRRNAAYCSSVPKNTLPVVCGPTPGTFRLPEYCQSVHGFRPTRPALFAV
jgi:MASE7